MSGHLTKGAIHAPRLQEVHRSLPRFRRSASPERNSQCSQEKRKIRAGELSCLTPANFDLGSEPPTVSLRGNETKNGQTAIQPLPPDVTSVLMGYLKNQPSRQPIWPGTWHEKAAEMLRIDLDAASIPYIVEGPDGPLFADFHALRHSYVALLDQTGVSLKQAMHLARHSDSKLTMARYGRPQLHDLGAAVERFPSLLPAELWPEAMRATGTNDAFSCSPVAQTADTERHSLRLLEGGCGRQDENANRPQRLNSEGVESGCTRLILSEENSGGWDRTSDTRLMKPLL